MSWAFNVVAKDAKTAIEAAEKHHAENPTWFVPEAKDAVIAAIKTVPQNIGLIIEASGHKDNSTDGYGNCRIEIRTAKIVQ